MAAGLLAAGGAAAQGPEQAGLVVQFEAGRVESRCVDLAGERPTGAELLAASGLDVIIDASGGMGVTVCRIDGQGCDYPAVDCFCQCPGGADCRYWNYYYRDPGAEAWTYSPLGAALRQVQPGALEAWVWGDGHNPPAADLTFEAVCAAPAGTETAPVQTPTPAVEAPTDTPAAAPPTRAGAIAAATAGPGAPATAPAATATGAPAARAAGGTSYLLFGAMALALAAVGVSVWLRGRRA